MTFLDWCLEGMEIDDEYPIRVTRYKKDGMVNKVYEPNEEVPRYVVEYLKPLQIIGEPEFRDGVWYVDLQEEV